MRFAIIARLPILRGAYIFLVSATMLLSAGSGLAQAYLFQPNTQIPLVVVLWKDSRFGGTKREVIVDTPNLERQTFNDLTSAVGVHPGPDYALWKANHGGREPTISLFSDAGGHGKSIVLRAGIYPDLKPYNMNDSISSLYFGDLQKQALPPKGAAAPFNSIPFAIILFKDNSQIWLIESTADIAGDYGDDWNDTTTAASIFQRAGGVGHSIALCADKFYDDCSVEDLSKGKKADGGIVYGHSLIIYQGFDQHNFGLSSVKIR